MSRRIPFYSIREWLFVLLLALALPVSHAFAASLAGKLDFAFGKVSATGADGAARPLVKGSEVFSGDTVTTGDGRVQIRFTDGAYMALQPNTVFKVDQYAFNGKQDGTEKGSFSLVKGSLRTITGAIGHVNKQNYEVRTPTATIGIRGTAYSASQSDDGLTVTVERGAVAVSNQSGSITLGSGQSAQVRTPSSRPQVTDQKAALTQQTQQTQQQQVRQQEQQRQMQQQTINNNIAATGERRNPNGSSAALPSSSSLIELPPSPPP
ncbi:MAG TPA: FecR domain-containing protein [Oxalicibacterium sp.]|nr:FecR domain-containing protein [Oxalicibacterium sp.]